MSKINSIIRRCSCKHPGQDELHGPSMRVMNLVKTKDKDIPLWRCTVCSKEISLKVE